MVRDEPGLFWRVKACPHQLQHEAMPLPGQSVDLLSEEFNALVVSMEKVFVDALDRHVISTPRSPVYLRGASLPYLLF